MTPWTIRRLIIASFGVILSLMVVMTIVAYTRLARIDAETRAAQTGPVPRMYYSALMQDAWSDDFLLTEEHVIQRDNDWRERVDAKLRTSRTELDALSAKYEATISSAETVQAYDEFKKVRAGYTRIQDEVLAMDRDAQRQPEALAKIRTVLTPEFEKGQAAISAVVTSSKTSWDASAGRISDDVSAAMTSGFVILGVALALAVVCGVNLLRAITRPLGTLNGVVEVMRKGDFTQRVKIDRHDEIGVLADGFNRMTDELTRLVGQVQKSGLQVSTSVTEIAATAKEQQATANEIAATTTEIGATSREISATSKELVKTMSDVSTVAEQSAALAGSGQTGLTHMETTMQQVMDAAGAVTAKLATLNEKAGDISQVVTTITKVADQTNLLSLNAAIEAEKAGEYGRGFAVVATEIRRLADQTAVATYDIDQMVKAIQSAVAAGVMSMDKFSEDVRRGMQAVQDVSRLLTQVIQQVQALAPRFEAVTEGMQAQAVGAEQITDALTQLSEAARQTVESLRQSNLAIDELNQVSVGLRNGVSRFALQEA
jgi:methyl-accepting chemotaxis protein WspA